jgi:hypothetical protein
MAIKSSEGTMSHSAMLRLLGILGLALAVAVPAVVQAQDAPPVRVRGTIERVEGDTFIVKSRDGAELKVGLSDKALIVAIVKASLSDIKPNTFVGVTGMPQPDGSQRALEVHIFPEAMRGTGEGHYAWDLRPQSTMTNGNVERSVASADGQVLTLKFKDGEKKIVVPPDTPIVGYMPGDKSELKAGVKIFIGAARKQADGTLQTPRINYGERRRPADVKALLGPSIASLSCVGASLGTDGHGRDAHPTSANGCRLLFGRDCPPFRAGNSGGPSSKRMRRVGICPRGADCASGSRHG